jgi:hypothetical protein
MTVVNLTAIHAKPGASWEDLQKQLKKGGDFARKHGGENVTVLVGMAAGTETGMLSLLHDQCGLDEFREVPGRPLG